MKVVLKCSRKHKRNTKMRSKSLKTKGEGGGAKHCTHAKLQTAVGLTSTLRKRIFLS